ncbi:T9SS type A sorting domain-containing protein [Tamlana sp. I1]|uniref:T9SS type A sorting domain-containing protein n=1 Tax=Tamlana sp. I1 TaxID=2762061 RepID=UPI00188DE00E|nr:T9SS type A sorting domain-containing protein [Tamlana sp. I1]
MKNNYLITNIQNYRNMSKCIFALFVLIFSASLQAQTIHINTDNVLNKIPAFGYNMIPANHGFGIIANDGNFDPNILNALVNMELPVLRFPGGTYGNLYEWKRAIGPKANRGGMHGWKYIPDDNWFGPDEAGQLMEQTNGELTILVNFNQGAAYAADWVEYMNAEVGANPNGGIDWAQVRADNGHPEPYNVKTWEIANEGGNSRIWPRWPYDGDNESDQLAFNDPVFRDLVAYGGSRTYTNQTLVRDNAWNVSYIRTKGTPNEDFQVRWYPLVKESFELKVGVDAASAVSYTRVDDFGNSASSDLHYTLNEETGEVLFGDGTNGAIPPAGQNVYANYTTQNLDGHVQIYNAMKAVDPNILISDGFFFISEYELNDPSNVKSEGTQQHMAAETMKKFDQYYGTDVFKNAVGIATGSFPTQLDKNISNYTANNGKEPNLFLTEYGIMDRTLVNGVEHARTIASAIYYALLNYEIAKRGNLVQVANINYLFNHGNNKESAMREGQSHVNANGITTEMYSKYFGNQLVSTTSTNIPEQSYTYDPFTFGTTSETHNIPKLYSHASIDISKKEAYLMVINTTDDENITSSISGEGNGFQLDDLKSIKKLSATSLTAINTAGVSNNIKITDETIPTVINQSISWDFPPASVTTFVFNYSETLSTEDFVPSNFGTVEIVQQNGRTASYKFEFSNGDERIKNIEVYSVLGEIVYKDLKPSKSHVKLELPELNAGIYIIHVHTGYNYYMKKVFVF